MDKKERHPRFERRLSWRALGAAAVLSAFGISLAVIRSRGMSKPEADCNKISPVHKYINPLMNRTSHELQELRCQIEGLIKSRRDGAYETTEGNIERLVVSAPEFHLDPAKNTYRHLELAVSKDDGQITSAAIQIGARTSRFNVFEKHKRGWNLIISKLGGRASMFVEQYVRLSDGEADPLRGYPIEDTKVQTRGSTLEAINQSLIKQTYGDFAKAAELTIKMAEAASAGKS